VLVVDSGVWIDYFNGARRAAVDRLDHLLERGEIRLVVPDLVLFEVLRGFRDEQDYRRAWLLLDGLHIEATGGEDLALEAARHYRDLRARGVTVRSAVDVLLATFCIDRGYELLHDDRDFDAFERWRGLKVWRH
jgi:predicted nucleic acid-binding protein